MNKESENNPIKPNSLSHFKTKPPSKALSLTSIITNRTLNKIPYSFFLPANPLLKPTKIPTISPKFGKMKSFLYLPQFIQSETQSKLDYQPFAHNNHYTPNEKVLELQTYINSPSMLSKLIYLKTKLTKDNKIDVQNIVNVNKTIIQHSHTATQSFINKTDYLKLNDNKEEELKPFYKLKSNNDNTLIFESRFECGNLLCAFKVDECNYELYLHNDTNTNGYTQWFFFRISNCKKGKKINIDIKNMLRKNSMYSNGLKIVCYSQKKSEIEKIGWHHTGANINYYPNNLFVWNKEHRRNLFSLHFEYEISYDNDIVYFSNSIPYFYTELMSQLNQLQLNDNIYPFFHRKTLCTTLCGNDFDMFSINSLRPIQSNSIDNNNNNNKNGDQRKVIILFARQHPGESVGSHVIKGAFDFLMGKSDEATKLRELYMFIIIPMMNPDGVLVGNSRTSLAGCDLNRRWENPNEIMHPEIYTTKNMIIKTASQRDIAIICDFHGHSYAFNSFFYGNTKEDKRECSLLPFIVSKINNVISFKQSYFKMPVYKKGTMRINLFNKLKINNILALETSYFGIKEYGQESGMYYTTEMLRELGRDFCIGVLAYYYKVENISIDKMVNEEMDVHIEDFEEEIANEEKKKRENENEDVIKDEDMENEASSESEPSIDNFEIEKIMKLMPMKNRKRKKSKMKIKINSRLYKHNSVKKLIINAQLNELKSEIKGINQNQIKPRDKTGDGSRIYKNNSISKISINCRGNTKISNGESSIPAPIVDVFLNLAKDAETQTEEIFFKMHWVYFVNDYPILEATYHKSLLMTGNIYHKPFVNRTKNKGQGFSWGSFTSICNCKKIYCHKGVSTIPYNNNNSNNKNNNNNSNKSTINVFRVKKNNNPFSSYSNTLDRNRFITKS